MAWPDLEMCLEKASDTQKKEAEAEAEAS